ncbi:MAG TPA: DNA-3-methyladenine glycosylase [Candidatus Saccharimonadales bacterium]
MMITGDDTTKQAASYLAEHDSALKPVIENVGLCTIRPHKNYYQELVESIISQQLSVKAAATIFKRFKDLFGGGFPAPEEILAKSIDELRSVGLSRGKAMYVRDLAQHVLDGKVRFDHLDSLSNEEIIRELTAVKGIGEWTAHMFMMFCMGRMDVLAHGDLGIKNGIQKLYSLDHQPSAQEVAAVAAKNNWHPYESIACWYVWKSLDNAPKS